MSGTVTRNLAGQRFVRLVVLSKCDSRYGGRWLCRCDCGEERVVYYSNLMQGRTTSCGCLHREVLRARATHGDSRANKLSATYKTWSGIKRRCNNPNEQSYAYYGARGIKVCERWERSYEAFLDDMGPKPPGTSIDRIDNERGYEPGNCRWATQRVQTLNRRNIKLSYEKAQQIRRLASAGNSQRSIAKQFGVDQKMVWLVVNMKVWNE